MDKKQIIYFFVFLIFSVFFAEKIFFADRDFKAGLTDGLRDFTQKENSPSFLKSFESSVEEMKSARVSFLEVNLEEMTVRIYKKGGLAGEFPIIAKGNKDKWGGSAAGIFKIESGNKISFSNISKVYMPFSLHYFGKYYIHGEPYYPGGEELISRYSGGCLRLRNEDAEALYEAADLEMPVAVIPKKREKENFKFNSSVPPEISAGSYLVADFSTGRILSEKNADLSWPAGFLARLMLSVTVADTINLERQIESGGRSIRVIEFFYPLLTGSSEEPVSVLSSFLGENKTLRLMNQQAQAMLMENSRFNSLQSQDLQNTSTARDLFYLAEYILTSKPPIFKISKGEKVETFGPTFLDLKNLENKNIFFRDPSFLGGMTDFSGQGYSALFAFEIKGRILIFSILGSENLKEDTQLLYSWIFSGLHESF